MYNQAAHRQERGIYDATKVGIKHPDYVGDIAYEGGWQIGLSRLPIDEMAALIDEHGIQKLIATWNIVAEGD